MKNYLEEQYLQNNLFLNERFLEIDYIPNDILHREQELLILSKIFIKIIESPFEISRKILIQGPIGVGKTLITKEFGKMVIQSGKKRSINLRYIHINCRKHKSSYKILRSILIELGLEIPKRGYSSQELITIFQNYLENEEIYILLTLDELNYLLKSDFDLIYALSRFNDSDFQKNSYISIISILRDFSLIKNLDPSTISTLQENILIFKKYNKNQLYDILKQRIDISVKLGVFSDDLIKRIVSYCYINGDVRTALNITRTSIKNAELKGKFKVDIEDFYDSIKNIISSNQNDYISTLNLHELVFLESICNALISNSQSLINIKEIKENYDILCENMQIEPRKNTQLWNYLNSFKKSGILNVKIKSKGQRGRSSYYSLSDIPAEILKEKIENLLNTMREVGNYE